MSLLSLPAELLITIVELACDDTQTAVNLCIATKGVPRLHEIALAKRWQKITIDDRDLVPAPGDDSDYTYRVDQKMNESGLVQKLKPRGWNVRLLTKQLDGNGRCLANHIRDLSFDLGMRRYFVEAASTGNTSSINSDIWKLMPTLASLEHTLNLLQPHLIDVRTVECNGVVPQVMLNVLVRLKNSCKIRDLSVYKLYSPGRLVGMKYLERECRRGRDGSGQRWCYWRDPIDYTCLQPLHGLTSLAIHKLKHEEVPSLVTLLPQLSHLAYLTIADEEHDYCGDPPTCAMRTLIKNLCHRKSRETSSLSPTNSNRIFPASLISLELSDNHFHRRKWVHINSF